MMIRVNQPLILTENSPHRTLHSSFHSIYVIHLQCHNLQSFLRKSHFVLIVIWTNFLFGVFKYLLDNNVYLLFFSSSNSKMRFKCCPMLASFNSRSHSRLALWFVLRLISNQQFRTIKCNNFLWKSDGNHVVRVFNQNIIFVCVCVCSRSFHSVLW